MPNNSGKDSSGEITGLVFNIQRFSIHDGPGIRTLIFMQGCPLRCKWCCNPEGQKSYPQLRYIPVKCAYGDKCSAPCVDVCPEGATFINAKGKLEINWSRCTNCGKCTEVCIYGARTMLGKEMSVSEVMEELERDSVAYRKSGGGITIGGGEPLMQVEFVLEILKRCKAKYFHTTMETCGNVPWEYIKDASEYLDLLYYDIKHMDPQKHEEMAGGSNELILVNARKALSGGVNCHIIVRTEVIPGCNDSEENIAAIAEFVAEAGGKEIELLPYHALGSSKYKQLGMKYELSDAELPSEEKMRSLRKIAESFKLKEMTGVM